MTPQRPALAAAALAVALAPLSLVSTATAAPLNVTATTNTAQLAAAIVDDPSITISNVQFTGGNRAAGVFSGAQGILPFSSGVVLSTGDVTRLRGPNDEEGSTTEPDTTRFDLPGNALLDGIVGAGETSDAAVLSFDFVPTGNNVSFQFAFGSEEYKEFVGTAFNDVFGFFLNGQNIALVPGTTDRIAVNSVNDERNTQFFTDNEDGSIPVQLDGLVGASAGNPLFASGLVNPGVVNTIVLAIADAGDSILDSAVFLAADTFVDLPPEENPGGNPDPDPVDPDPTDPDPTDPDPVDPGPTDPGTPAVVPLPAGAWAGLATLGGLAVVGRKRRATA